MNAVPEITREIAAKVLSIVDAGLVKGVGKPVPGEMCVEAAVCFAMGLPHGDEPTCVSSALRQFKIRLNDSRWSSNQSRAKGLRRLALVQLGTRDTLDDREFANRVAKLAIQTCVPTALRAAAVICKNDKLKSEMLNAANRCEKEGTRESALNAKRIAAYAADAYAAAAAAYAAATYAAAAYAAAAAAAAADATAARDKSLADFAEAAVQVLIDMDAPGAQWLDLAPLEAAS